MMISTLHSEEFWTSLERVVSATVEEALREPQAPRATVIAYLRNIEEMAQLEPDRRQTLQIIASGRSLLGDRTEAGVPSVPFESQPRGGGRPAPGLRA